MRQWHGCYEGGWNGLIVPEAFAHPAKMAYGLVNRIYDHAFEQGWLSEGDTVAVTEEILAELKKDIDTNQYQQLE